MKTKDIFYVGKDLSILPVLKVFGEKYGLTSKIIESLENYISILEKEQYPIFIYDLEYQTIELDDFLRLQINFDQTPINIAVTSREEQVPDDFLIILRKEDFKKTESYILLNYLRKNADKLGDIIYTWKMQRDLIRNIPLGMYRTTTEGKFLLGNLELLNILEVPSFEILSKLNARDFYVNPADREKWIDLIFKNKVVKNFEFKLKTFKGKTKWVRNNARGIFRGGALEYIEGFLSDITEEKLFKEKEARLIENSLNQRLFLINLFKSRASYVKDIDLALLEIAENSCKVLNASRFGIWILKDGKYENKIVYDSEKNELQIEKMAFNDKIHHRYLNFLKQGIQISTPDVTKDNRLTELYEDYIKPKEIKSTIDTPIFVENELWGILKCEFTRKRDIDRQDEWFNHILAFYIANLLETARAIKAKDETQNYAKKLEKYFEEVILLLSRIVEERDPYTAGHQKRVALIAAAIAKQMGLSEEEQQKLYIAGLLHDIGKLYVPSEILTKPAKLNPVEFELVKIHPEKGYETLITLESLKEIAEIVRQHHERLDGSGYPRGLKNKQIIKEARIIAVADVTEAMLAWRPYRPSIPINEVLKYIDENKGKLFDAEVVEACKKVFYLGMFPQD
uniref:HD domain-containing protein n=1 Tax=candidate division WOR-3 bacterium TaxID=2052148 RepID=A0A7V3ZW71_UNCW3